MTPMVIPEPEVCYYNVTGGVVMTGFIGCASCHGVLDRHVDGYKCLYDATGYVPVRYMFNFVSSSVMDIVKYGVELLQFCEQDFVVQPLYGPIHEKDY